MFVSRRQLDRRPRLYLWCDLRHQIDRVSNSLGARQMHLPALLSVASVCLPCIQDTCVERLTGLGTGLRALLDDRVFQLSHRSVCFVNEGCVGKAKG